MNIIEDEIIKVQHDFKKLENGINDAYDAFTKAVSTQYVLTEMISDQLVIFQSAIMFNKPEKAAEYERTLMMIDAVKSQVKKDKNLILHKLNKFVEKLLPILIIEDNLPNILKRCIVEGQCPESSCLVIRTLNKVKSFRNLK